MGDADATPDAVLSVNRHWKTHDSDDTMHVYLTMRHRLTLRELVAYLDRHHPGVDPWTVELNFGSATWDEPATATERVARLAWRVEQRERTEAWERRKYVELKAKFESTEINEEERDG